MRLLVPLLLLIPDVVRASLSTSTTSTSSTTTPYKGPPTTTTVYTGPPTTTTAYTGSPTTSTSTTSTTTTTTPSTTTVTTTRYTGPPTTTTAYTGPPTTTTSTTTTTTTSTPSTTTVSTTPYTGPPTTSTTTTTPSTTTVTTTPYTGPPTTTTTGPTTTTTPYTGPPTTTTTSTTNTGSTTTTSLYTGSSTTNIPTTTTGCIDLNNNTICDVYEEMRCETVILQGKNYLIARIITYIATAWVVFWCLLTILINICHKNSGHHRGIHLWEELGIIVLWVFMGVLNLTFRNKNLSKRSKINRKRKFQLFCKIISIVIHYFVVFVAACFVFEAIFANSMVHNKKKKNGCCPAFFNYLLPIPIAALPCLLTYFLHKNDYGSNGMHCFVITELEIVYAFVIPVWALLSIATLYSSLGNLACDMTHSDQDQPQCYWAKKSCKVLPLLAYWIFLAYLTCMFGSSSQRLWVLILFVVQSLVLGPMIFVCHTFGHKNTAVKWYSPSLPGKFYRGCTVPAPPPFVPSLPIKSPPPRSPSLPPTPREKPPKQQPQPEPTSNVVRRSPPKSAVPEDEHMYANELWGWATTKNGDDAHFRPKPVSYDF